MSGDHSVPGCSVLGPVPDAESAAWVRSLGDPGPDHLAAVTRLHALLLRAARKEAHRRSTQLGISGSEVDDLAHQAAADALVAITAKVGQFRGESRFTTWAYKFVVFEVSTKFSRHFWRTHEAPMGEEDWERLPDRFGLAPDEESERRALIAAVRQAVDAELTEHQRDVFVAIVLNGIPLDVLVAQLGTNRNAIYKTLFDARRKLRSFLVANGHLEADALRKP